ncbi:MAG: NAD-binding protein, partial [Candidatus Aureabacteria bacterium]|nr:NAD-binding protein [Candidatus Auribacterota bacterium]
MKIAIIGAGTIGANLARHLSGEKHEVYLIESNKEVAAKANEKLDVKVIVGEGSDPG